MALPIKETPILKGKDAKKFLQKMEEVDAGGQAVPLKDYLRAKKVYRACTKGRKKPFNVIGWAHNKDILGEF